ncbi:PepSY domain-containing protein [Thiocystis violacea]|uniref:PepSY domain-containing protein n=1 Tax=Thiocystis violacea TaxID=13725 RepID=UPI0019054287|nr:PepSY domain-containing protein [Thiocystis violacea]MBK1717251.1 hypothetical protein [Thiocystis violacea]
MHTSSTISVTFALATLWLGSAMPASAAGHDVEPDHERARQALNRGEVQPIADILASVAHAIPGEVIEVEFDDAEDLGDVSWRYELKILADDGRLREVQVDAATGRILSVEED